MKLSSETPPATFSGTPPTAAARAASVLADSGPGRASRRLEKREKSSLRSDEAILLLRSTARLSRDRRSLWASGKQVLDEMQVAAQVIAWRKWCSEMRDSGEDVAPLTPPSDNASARTVRPVSRSLFSSRCCLETDADAAEEPMLSCKALSRAVKT